MAIDFVRVNRLDVWFLCLCCVIYFYVDIVSAQNSYVHGRPSPDFSRHTAIKPKFYHGREKRQISSTRENEGSHAHDVMVSFAAHGRHYTLELQLNRELTPRGYFESVQRGGKAVVSRPTLPNHAGGELCHYKGAIQGAPESWVAVSTCTGLKGMMYDGKDVFYIQGDDAGFGDTAHFLYRHDDLIKNATCGYVGGDQGGHHTDDEEEHHHEHHEFNRILRYKRSSDFVSTDVIRGPYNANKQSRYVELVLVVDNKEYKALGENAAKVHHHCKDIANIINALYAPLNIFVALVGVVIWSENDEIQLTSNGDTTLTNFLHYRRGRLVKDHPNDNAQLLTREQFEGGVVGKALKGPICTYEFSGGVSMDHSDVVGLVATTVAHEMGHNFGMEHDTSECDCPDERCIMAPSSSSLSPTHWSSCSLEYLALAFEHGMDYCLRNKPERLFDSPVCGNGFVEAGEQCDCGLPDRCDNTCCNASTCMLHSNASCATGECCDLLTCRPKKAGSLCRSSDQECDLPEYCTGESEYCPADVYKRNTEKCDSGKAFCYQGSCRTRSDQCRLLWGPSGRSSDDKCYEMNTKGSRHGNCGYNRLNQSYIRCNDEHVFCGMLHCKHLNERLEFGMESVAILSHSFINAKGAIIPCRTAIVDLGLNQVDPGLAPDGAKCGEGKMCVNQKCMEVSSLRVTGHSCPNDCHGNGVCNSLGHCHCATGFAPPHCDYPGPGGSQDSGPASDPNARKEVIVAMYVIFLGIVPLVALVGLLSYYTRHNPVLWWKKTSGTPTSQKSPPHTGWNVPTRSNVLSFCPTSPQSINNSPGPNSPDELSSSLLQSESETATQSAGIHNNFFGHFKGFSLTPIQKIEEQSNNIQATSAAVTFANPKPINLNTDRRNKKNIAMVHPTTKTVSADKDIESKAPIRSAPPVPTVPTIKNPVLARVPSQVSANKPSVMRSVSTVRPNTLSSVVQGVNNVSTAPALPPLNPGAHPRPLISEPILEASTCTAKELISPLKHTASIPARIAPEVPVQGIKRPLSTPNCVNNTVVIPSDDAPKKPKEGGNTLNRIASFLKNEKSKPVIVNTNSLPRNAHNQIKKPIDKNTLRTLQISNPIPQKDIVPPDGSIPVIADSDDDDETKLQILRAQSMRAPVLGQRPNIPAFGSMRQSSSAKRPTSIPVGNRPTSPPPPRPPQPNTATGIVGLPGYQNPPQNTSGKPPFIKKIPGLPGYQNPTMKSAGAGNLNDMYDDCALEGKAPLANINEEMSPSSGDNIYAVIEESPVSNHKRLFSSKSISPSKVLSPKSDTSSPSQEGYKTPKPLAGSGGSNSDSMGLLGEIVSEIQNINFDSIYSTSSLARKKKEKQNKERCDQSEDDSVRYVDKDSVLGGSDSSLGTYANTSEAYKSPDSVYSNMSVAKSIASTTSSGYLHPAAVNGPKVIPTNSNDMRFAEMKKVETPSSVTTNTTSSFKSTLQRPPGPLASTYKSFNNSDMKEDGLVAKTSPPSPTQKVPLKLAISRSVTPPNLQSASRPTTARTVPSSPKNLPKSNNKTVASKTQDPLNNVSQIADKEGATTTIVTNKGATSYKPSVSAPKPAAGKQLKQTQLNAKTLEKTSAVKVPTTVEKKKASMPPKVTGKPETVPKAGGKLQGEATKPPLFKSPSDATAPKSSIASAARSKSNVASLQQKFESAKK